MKKKIAVIAVIAFIAVILSLNCFAFSTSDRAPFYNNLSQNTYIKGYGLYGGIFTVANYNGINGVGRSATSSMPSQKSGLDDTVTYTVFLDTIYDGIVHEFIIPYDTDRYIGNIRLDFTIPDQLKDYSDYVIGYSVAFIELDLITYDVHYNNSETLYDPETYQYTVLNSDNKALRVQVQLRECNEPIPVTIQFQFTDLPSSTVVNQGNTINILNNFLRDNTSSINTVFGYLSQIWSFGYIQILITISVLLTVIAILFNWGVSL